jgi:hypothetical protein
MSKTRDLEKKLDELTSKVVLLRDDHCITCGSSFNLECGHYFSRTWRGTRWDLDNCHAQCHWCNQKHEYDANPYDNWMEDNYDVIEIEKKAFNLRKIGYSEMLLIYKELKEKEKEYGQDFYK